MTSQDKMERDGTTRGNKGRDRPLYIEGPRDKTGHQRREGCHVSGTGGKPKDRTDHWREREVC